MEVVGELLLVYLAWWALRSLYWTGPRKAVVGLEHCFGQSCRLRNNPRCLHDGAALLYQDLA